MPAVRIGDGILTPERLQKMLAMWSTIEDGAAWLGSGGR